MPPCTVCHRAGIKKSAGACKKLSQNGSFAAVNRIARTPALSRLRMGKFRDKRGNALKSGCSASRKPVPKSAANWQSSQRSGCCRSRPEVDSTASQRSRLTPESAHSQRLPSSIGTHKKWNRKSDRSTTARSTSRIPRNNIRIVCRLLVPPWNSALSKNFD